MKRKWLNSTVIGASLTSLLSDLSHESVTVLLPSFLVLLGSPVYALGLIEGASDGLSSFAKLLSGFYSDRVGRKKEISTLGYVITGVFPGLLLLAGSWVVVLFARVFGWAGRGVRGPPRDALLSNSVEKKDLGKAFGFHRAGDTIGAIGGPLLAFLLFACVSYKGIFIIAVGTGLLAAVVFWVTVKEEVKEKKKGGKEVKFFASIKELPERYKNFLSSVFLFGIADFSHTLLIFLAITRLAASVGLTEATALGVLLYAVRNITYAVACYPFGVLGDRHGRRNVLCFGYAIAVLTFIGFILLPPLPINYFLLFALAGIYIACEDTLEGAAAGEMVRKEKRGMGFGTLAAINGIGDFASSIIVASLWSLYGFTAGLLFSLAFASIGTMLLITTGRK